MFYYGGLICAILALIMALFVFIFIPEHRPEAVFGIVVCIIASGVVFMHTFKKEYRYKLPGRIIYSAASFLMAIAGSWYFHVSSNPKDKLLNAIVAILFGLAGIAIIIGKHPNMDDNKKQ